MATPKRYIHDRLVLLLLTTNAFFAILTSILILLKLDSSRADSYIVQYRPTLGLGGYVKGDTAGVVSMVVFVLFVFVFHAFLSNKVYPIRRHFALVILGMGLLLILMTLVISNALLLLRR